MTEKRFKRYLFDGGFSFDDEYIPPRWSILDENNNKSPFGFLEFEDEHKDLCDEIVDNLNEFVDEYNHLKEENEQLKYKINDLLYQIEYVGKNNKSCDGCECFLEDIGYCWMWDMNVKKEDIVVACDKRKMMQND